MENDTNTAEGFTPLPAGLELEVKLYATNGEVDLTLSVVSQFEPKAGEGGITSNINVDEMLAGLPKLSDEDTPWRAMTRGEITAYKAEEAAASADMTIQSLSPMEL